MRVGASDLTRPPSGEPPGPGGLAVPRGRPGGREMETRPGAVNLRGDADPGKWTSILPAQSPSPGGAQLPDVEAHITGTVWKIEVAVGDQIDEGDTVVILESMKMEMPVEAEDPGEVTEILVAEGQSVSEGDTLVVLT